MFLGCPHGCQAVRQYNWVSREEDGREKTALELIHVLSLYEFMDQWTVTSSLLLSNLAISE